MIAPAILGLLKLVGSAAAFWGLTKLLSGDDEGAQSRLAGKQMELQAEGAKEQKRARGMLTKQLQGQVRAGEAQQDQDELLALLSGQVGQASEMLAPQAFGFPGSRAPQMPVDMNPQGSRQSISQLLG